MTVRLVTWNLLGSAGPSVEAVAGVLAPLDVDVVLLQEVQRRQARGIARALGGWNVTWTFKHWPLRVPAEGLAILSRLGWSQRRRIVLRPAPWWDWRRRVALVVELDLPEGPVVVVNAHLSPHHAQRAGGLTTEVERLERALAEHWPGQDSIVAGDLNDSPGGAAHRALVSAGRHDAWAAVHGDLPEPAGATNWTPGPRRGRAPTQRLDHVLVPAGWEPISARVLDDDGLAELSDHLPLVVEVRTV